MGSRADIELIGRDQVLLELAALLARRRSITLTGPGGIGKTSIARVLAAAAAGPERAVTFVDLAGVTASEPLAARVAASLGIDETPDLDPTAAIDAALVGTTALLVLDNLEGIPDAGRWIGERLAASPTLQVLGTSRVRLRHAEETPYPVEGLELPLDESEGAVRESAAGALFLERAGASVPDLRVSDGDWPHLARLLRRLDGMPLAIELAAARTRILPPGAMLRRLGQPGLLERAGGDPRHASLEAVIAWSLRLLVPSQRELLDLLAAWTGEIELGLIERLRPGGETLGDLDALVESGLVVVVRRAEPRFRVLETVREALRREGSGDAERHVAAWLAGQLDAWAVSLGGRTPGGEVLFGAAAATVDELVGRLSASEPALAHALIVAATPYRALVGGLRGPLEDARAALAADAPRTRIRALLATSMLLAMLTGGGAGRGEAEAAITLASEVGDQELELAATYRAAIAALDHGDPATGDLLLRSLAMADSAGRPVDALAIRQRLADMGQDAATAIRGLAPLVGEAEALGDPVLLASVLNDLAANETLIGMDEEALGHARRSMALCAEAGSPLREAWTASIAIQAAARLRRVDEAADLLASALEATPLGGASLRGFLLGSCLPLLGVLGDWRTAARVVGAHETHYRATGASNSGDEDLRWARDVASIRRQADPVAWHLELEAGRSLPLADALDEVLASVRSRERGTRRAPFLGLTPREVEVLALLGAGLSDPEIGRALFISPKTASVHVANIKAKLEVTTRLEAAIRARELGIVASP